MSPEELARFDVLYRRTTVHLAQVTTRSRDVRLASYLNNLTAAAHSIIYLPPRESAIQGAISFIAVGFPAQLLGVGATRPRPRHCCSRAPVCLLCRGARYVGGICTFDAGGNGGRTATGLVAGAIASGA